MKTIALGAILLMLPLLGSAQYSKNFLDQPYMEVTGKAELEVIPNEIFLKINIQEEDYKGKKSLEALEREMIKELNKLGINTQEDLSILDFSSNFKEHLLRKNSIQTAKQYQLKVNDGLTTAKVFIVLEEIGLSKIHVDKVGHSDIEKLQNDVKVKAIKAAKAKAEMLAAGIDQEIGPALFIQEVGNNYYPRQQRAGNMMVKSYSASADMEALPLIEFEKLKLEYSILVKFQLK